MKYALLLCLAGCADPSAPLTQETATCPDTLVLVLEPRYPDGRPVPEEWRHLYPSGTIRLPCAHAP